MRLVRLIDRYWHLTNRGDSGIAGILFTFFIDLVLMCVAASLVYGYVIEHFL